MSEFVRATSEVEAFAVLDPFALVRPGDPFFVDVEADTVALLASTLCFRADILIQLNRRAQAKHYGLDMPTEQLAERFGVVEPTLRYRLGVAVERLLDTHEHLTGERLTVAAIAPAYEAWRLDWRLPTATSPATRSAPRSGSRTRTPRRPS